ncbi:MAG: hypothetical protein H6739_19615 [Alphaproteobacteria bacterium]|nr:hypothetical protein [Alphaproteobacteria bacterium]
MMTSPLSGAAWAGGCPAPTTSAEVSTHARAAADAFFVTADQDAFVTAVAAMRAAAPCLGEPITGEHAAQLHLVGALEALVEQRDADVTRALRAAVAASGTFDLTGTQAPPGSPLRTALDQARADQVDSAEPVAAPRCVTVWVDGTPSTSRATDRPAVLQPVGPGHEVLWTQVLAAGEDPPPVSAACGDDRLTRRDGGGSAPAAKVGLGAGAAVSAGAAGAFLFLADRAKTEWQGIADQIAVDDPEILDPTPQQVSHFTETLPRQANAFSGAAIGAGAVALGLGATLVLTW